MSSSALILAAGYWLLAACTLSHLHIDGGSEPCGVFNAEKQRRREAEDSQGRFARLGKRVAARGFARARRAAGGIACKPASALGPPQRCVASPPPDLETRFAGHGRPTGKGLRGAFRPGFKPSWDFSTNFLSRRTAGFPSGEARKAPKGLGQGAVGGGELVHRVDGGAAPQAVADGSLPSRFPKFARSAQPRTLCFSASLPLCVRDQPRTCALHAKVCKCANV